MAQRFPNTDETTPSQGPRLICNPKPAKILIGREDMDPDRAE